MEQLASNTATDGLPPAQLSGQLRSHADPLRRITSGKKYRTAARGYRPNPLIRSPDPAGSAPVGRIGQPGSPESDSKPGD